MSIQSEIERIQANIARAYSAVGEMGGMIPQEANSGNLWWAIMSIGVIKGAVYLDGTAADDGDGTLLSPCGSLESAIEKAGDGGTILVLGTVTLTEPATYSANVTIMPAPRVHLNPMFAVHTDGVITLERMTISGEYIESRAGA